MSRYPLVVSLIALLTLAGCSSSTSNVVQAIQDKTVQICQYLPSAQSTLDIIKASTNVDVNGIAKAICDAVVAWANQGKDQISTPVQGLMSKPDCPRVNGVCVDGTFVDKDGKPVEEKPNG